MFRKVVFLMGKIMALEASGVVSSMSSSLEAVKGDALSAIATVAPFAISVMGAFLVWRYGIRFFKSLSK